MPATKAITLKESLADAIETRAAQDGTSVDDLVERALTEMAENERRARLREAFIAISEGPEEEQSVEFAFVAQSEVVLAEE